MRKSEEMLTDTTNHGRLDPKGMYGWMANNSSYVISRRSRRIACYFPEPLHRNLYSY